MDWFKKKIFWFALLALIVFLMDIYLYANKDTLKNTITFFGLQPTTPTADKGIIPTAANTVNSTSAIETIKYTSQANNEQNESTNTHSLNNSIYLTNDPENEELKIIERAKSLKIDEIKSLKQNSLDTSLNQDLRFESVYLLSKSDAASKELTQIILTPIPSSIKERQLDFENILRAQAVEGIQNATDKRKSLSLLNEIMHKTDNVFLLERLNRAQLFLKNGGDSLEVQDRKQLEKVLGN